MISVAQSRRNRYPGVVELYVVLFTRGQPAVSRMTVATEAGAVTVAVGAEAI